MVNGEWIPLHCPAPAPWAVDALAAGLWLLAVQSLQTDLGELVHWSIGEWRMVDGEWIPLPCHLHLLLPPRAVDALAVGPWLLAAGRAVLAN